MKTGLKDCNGHNIHEGDYIKIIDKSGRAGTVNEAAAPYLSQIGRVVWDTRRKEWQIMRMYVPCDWIQPEVWGKAKVDWLGEYNSSCCKIVLDAESLGYKEWSAAGKLKGDWHPETFFSGGIKVPYTTYRKAHQKE